MTQEKESSAEQHNSVKDYADSLLSMANSDLCASKILVDTGCFPQAVFSFQQGVEKANKAIALLTNFLALDELRKVSHNHNRIHTKILHKQLTAFKALQQNDKLEEFFKHISSSINKDINIGSQIELLEIANLEKANLEGMDILTATAVEIQQLVKYLNEQCIVNESFIDQISELLKVKVEAVLEGISEFVALHMGWQALDLLEGLGEEKAIDELSNVAKLMVMAIIDFFPSFLKLYISGFVTSSLAKVRYPDYATGFDPLKELNNNHPLIVYLPELIELVTKAVNQLSKKMKNFNSVLY